MIWSLLFISFGLASARENVEPEFLDELIASGQHDKFAELLGIQKHLVRPDNNVLGIQKHLVRPDNNEGRSEGSILNQASFLGDILLTEEQDRNAIDFNYYGGSRWPNGIIPYVISSSYDANKRKIILDAINDFNSKVTNVKLVPRRRHKDYVFIFSGNGCYSNLGKVGGQQGISLQANGCVSRGTVQHEFIHAVGFTHEHNRLDRDNHVEVLFKNIPEAWHSQYEKVSEPGWKDIGDYDWYSIMHYPIWAPDTNGLDAFAVPGGIEKNRLGQGKDDGVTDEDIKKINALYA